MLVAGCSRGLEAVKGKLNDMYGVPLNLFFFLSLGVFLGGGGEAMQKFGFRSPFLIKQP